MLSPHGEPQGDPGLQAWRQGAERRASWNLKGPASCGLGLILTDSEDPLPAVQETHMSNY